VIIILISVVLPGMLIVPAVTLPQSVTIVGVRVSVEVGVTVGVSVGVSLVPGVAVSSGGCVYQGPVSGVLLGVAVGVSEATGVSDGAVVIDVGGTVGGGGVTDEVDASFTYPRMVRALDEINVREPNGTSLV
jgi:hypothetical protein